MSRVRHGGLASNPSASKAETFVNCTASHVLPQSPEQTEQAERGTGGHKPLSDVINGTGTLSAEDRALVQAFVDDLAPGVTRMRAEAAYVVNVKNRTSRFVGVNIGRNYGELGPYDMGVSLDAEGVKDDFTAWVRDWKFGTYSSEWQLVVQAMAVLFSSPSQVMIDAGFVYMDIGNDSLPFNPILESYTWGRMDLEDKANELVRAFDRVKFIAESLRKSELPQLNQGPWCKYCPAQATCPAKWSMVRAALGEMATLGGMVEAMTLDKCGEAWAWKKEIEKFTKAVDATLRQRLESSGGFPLPNGKTLVLEPRAGKKTLNMDKTMALLDELGATKEQKGSIVNIGGGSLYAMERKL